VGGHGSHQERGPAALVGDVDERGEARDEELENGRVATATELVQTCGREEHDTRELSQLQRLARLGTRARAVVPVPLN
jgi:hypothetical protein